MGVRSANGHVALLPQTRTGIRREGGGSFARRQESDRLLPLPVAGIGRRSAQG